ncbi:MAG: HNH endonuclease signature motif containing protein [Streptococcus sp.]|nr:HNH endonuclease signature motif containing protein [Streptococcus sp.]
MGKKILTDEQHDFFVKIQNKRTSKEVARILSEKFALNISASQIKTYRKNHHIHSGLTGRFQKGMIPHNKGKKFPGLKNSGQFKSGNLPKNKMAVGTITYTTDGYPKIKVAEPNIWEYCHRREWEKHHGPIPKNHLIAFLDGDKSNWNIDNLICLNRGENQWMNKGKMWSSNQELSKASVLNVRLKRKIKERAKR